MEYTKEQIENIEDSLFNYSYEDIQRLYEEFLDEVYEPVELAGMTIHASDMKHIDPTMFSCNVNDYISAEFIEINDFYYRESDIADLLESLV